jgi:hypothetical protein
MEQEAALNAEVQEGAGQAISLPVESSRVKLRLEIPTGSHLEVDVEAYDPGGQLLGRQRLVVGGALPGQLSPLALPGGAKLRALAAAISHVSMGTLTDWLMWVSLVVYTLLHLVALPSFPIYFFTDEAIQTVQAADLLRDGWRSAGELLPTLFQNGSQYNLGTSVYLQVISYFFFGKSIWVTRGTAALATLLAALSVGLVLKKVFKNPYPWLGILFLSATPAWFLHSRTAFETGLATTAFAVFLYFYLGYREGSVRSLYAAVGAGAFTFYSYSPARIVILVMALLLLVSDLGYHWSMRKVVLRAFGLALVLALPFARFLYNHPEASTWQMRLLGSIWVADVPLADKLITTLKEYLHGLDPLYWYLPNSYDLVRHTMLGYGHLLRPTIPLGLLGIGLAVKNFRRSAYRVLLIAVLAAPAGAALVRLGITRALFMVIPMAILTALGAAAVLEWIRQRWKISARLLALASFLLLAGVNAYMLGDALLNGPLWFRSYSLAGMQYGAQQIFTEVRTYVVEHPEAHIVLSPSWANGTDVIARFFFDDPLPFDLGSAEGYYSIARPLDENLVFIMIPEEYHNLPLNRFSQVKVEKILSYPDGQPGFYFVRLKYVDNIQDVLNKELEERHALDYAEIIIGGQQVKVGYTKLDLGKIEFLFDGDAGTLARTWSVNPMQLTFDFPSPAALQRVTLQVGGTATHIQIDTWTENSPQPVRILRDLGEETLPRAVSIDLPKNGKIRRMAIEISNVNDPADGHVHVWEVTFQ